MSPPSVTRVIGAAGLCPPYPEGGGHKERGTAVDYGSRLLFQGYQLEDIEVDERIIAPLQSLALWLDHSKFKAQYIQKELLTTSFGGYVGHPDVFNEEIVIDTKTGSPAKHYKLQTAAYQFLTNSKRRACLYLKDDGSMAKFDEHKDKSDFAAFICALNIYHAEESLKHYREELEKWRNQ
jgi:hypothetical protein